MTVRAVAPGRVNLIGDHTDYVGGLAMPMAIDLTTEVVGERGGDRVELVSADQPEPASIELSDPLGSGREPGWARYVAGVVHEVRPAEGFTGRVRSSVPVGGGLSSSAALEVAVALAIGFDGPPRQLAETCQRAERAASGVPCGIMDQLTSVLGRAGHALLIDFATLEIAPVPLPSGASVVVIHSGESRRLAGSAYAERRSECEAAERVMGPLRTATLGDLVGLDHDTRLERRARHVITENERVRRFADALRSGRLDEAGQSMVESHASLRDDFEVSTPGLDSLVDRLRATPGVYGARLTGAGFGGCVVALTEPHALAEGWTVRPSAGASVELV